MQLLDAPSPAPAIVNARCSLDRLEKLMISANATDLCDLYIEFTKAHAALIRAELEAVTK